MLETAKVEIYSTDQETREYLAGLIRPRRGLRTRYEPVAPGVYKRDVAANG